MVLELVQVVAQQINVLHVELVVSKLYVYQLLKDRFKNTLENCFFLYRASAKRYIVIPGTCIIR